MTIESVIIHVADVDRSVEFYTRFLDLEVISRSPDEARLDAVTATFHLVRLADTVPTTFVADDLHAGFRHLGLKVSDLSARVERLKRADTVFHLDPLHAEGDVDLAFFYDPDGTMIELVEGDLQYHEVYDRSAVEADWALGRPGRPRFDHIGETVASLPATQEFFAAFGFTRMAGIHQPNDPRGFEIDFLRSGDVSLELFTFAADTSVRTPQTVARGFAAVQLVGSLPQGAPRVGTVAGAGAFADPDGLVVQVTGKPRGGRR